MPYLVGRFKNVKGRSVKYYNVEDLLFFKSEIGDVLDVFNKFFKFLSNRNVSHGKLNSWRVGIIYFGNDDTWSKVALNNLVAYGLGYVGFTESID